ncbi:MAG: phage tail protein [Candidatus Methylumidiphilus sp.]
MDFYLGQIIAFAGDYAPENFAKCDGSLLPIQSNQALFAVIGTTYGGDGRTNFALPDLRGRTPIGAGASPGLATYPLGSKGGQENVTLLPTQIPAHNHTLTAQASVAIPGSKASTSAGNQSSPANNILAAPSDALGAGVTPYAAASNANTTLGDAATATASFNAAPTSPTGGGAAHSNLSPYLALTYLICVNGLFPPHQ